MKRARSVITVGMMVAALGTASAHADGPIQQRKDNQQERIAQGVASGQLTAGETARLEGREAALNHEERAMRQADGGKLTAGDRAVINRQQNKLSGSIFRLKHNARRRRWQSTFRMPSRAPLRQLRQRPTTSPGSSSSATRS